MLILLQQQAQQHLQLVQEIQLIFQVQEAVVMIGQGQMVLLQLMQTILLPMQPHRQAVPIR